MVNEALSVEIRRLEERLARDPASPLFAPLADAYRKAGRLEAAITLCRDGLRRYPHYTTARMILARAYLETGDGAAAERELQEVLTQTPDDLQAHRLLAEIYRDRGEAEAAIRHLERVLLLDPFDAWARGQREVLRVQRPAGGRRTILEDDVFATVTFGDLCFQQGHYDDAIRIYSRVLGSDPGNVRARQRLDEALRSRGRRGAARSNSSGRH